MTGDISVLRGLSTAVKCNFSHFIYNLSATIVCLFEHILLRLEYKVQAYVNLITGVVAGLSMMARSTVYEACCAGKYQ